MNTPSDMLSTLLLHEVRKINDCHDESGRFCSDDGGSSGESTVAPKEIKAQYDADLKSGNKTGEKIWDGLAKKVLTVTERAATNEYVFGEDDDGLDTDVFLEDLRNGDVEGDVATLAKALDSAIYKIKTNEPVTVYRGFGTLSNTIAKAKVGQSIQDRGFVSTSLSAHAASTFSDSKTLAKIDIPKGSPALYMGHVTKDEAEVLLPRGTQFVVTGRSSTKIGNDKFTVVHFTAKIPSRPAPLKGRR